MDPALQIEKIFEKYARHFHFYLYNVITETQLEIGTKQRYPIGSCFKLAVLMSFFDSLKDRRELDIEIEIQPSQFSVGGGIINFLTTPVKLTYMQLAQMMVSFSDGTATDILIQKAGPESINRYLQRM